MLSLKTIYNLSYRFESCPDYHILSYIQLWLASAGHFCLKQVDSRVIPYHHVLLGNVIEKGSRAKGSVSKTSPPGQGSVSQSGSQD